MIAIRIGCARRSTRGQDLAAQREALVALGVAKDRSYSDHGMTGMNRARAGLDQVLAAARAGDTLVVRKLDRLARCVPEARAIAGKLECRGATLALRLEPVLDGTGGDVRQRPLYLRQVLQPG